MYSASCCYDEKNTFGVESEPVYSNDNLPNVFTTVLKKDEFKLGDFIPSKILVPMLRVKHFYVVNS